MASDEALTPPDLGARLHAIAKPFILQGRLFDVDDAIRLACDLLARDLDGPATTSVAVLPFGTPLRDCEPEIRAMLDEHGVCLAAEDATEDDRIGLLLKKFAAGRLSVGEIWGPLLFWLPTWPDQTAVQRALVQLITEDDGLTTPAAHAQIISAMRAVAACPLDASNAELPFRFKIEATLRVTERGDFITGTIEQGTIRIGDEIELVQLTDGGQVEIWPVTCLHVESIFQRDRDPESDSPVSIQVAGVELEVVKAGGWLRQRTTPDSWVTA